VPKCVNINIQLMSCHVSRVTPPTVSLLTYNYCFMIPVHYWSNYFFSIFILNGKETKYLIDLSLLLLVEKEYEMKL